MRQTDGGSDEAEWGQIKQACVCRTMDGACTRECLFVAVVAGWALDICRFEVRRSRLDGGRGESAAGEAVKSRVRLQSQCVVRQWVAVLLLPGAGLVIVMARFCGRDGKFGGLLVWPRVCVRFWGGGAAERVSNRAARLSMLDVGRLDVGGTAWWC